MDLSSEMRETSTTATTRR